MGHRGFGNLTKVSRLVYFGLSPFEQKAFKFYIAKGIPNLLRRMRRQVFLVLPGIGAAAYVIDWSRKENLAFSRKNPEDFANDE